MILKYSDESGQTQRVIGSAANPSTMVLIALARQFSPAVTMSTFAVMMLSPEQISARRGGCDLAAPCVGARRAERRRCEIIASPVLGVSTRPRPLPGRRKRPCHAAAFMDR
jgi:hypothetical protein